MLIATCDLATGTKDSAASNAVVEDRILSPCICGSLGMRLQVVELRGYGVAVKKQSSNRSVRALDPFMNFPG